MNKLLIILFCLPIIGFGQGWEKTIDYCESLLDAKQTNDNGYIFIGYSDNDYFLVKTNINGEEEWIRNIEILNPVQVRGKVFQTQDNGYIFFSDNGLVKSNNQGIIEWNFESSTNITDLHPTSDNNFIVLCLGEMIKIDLYGNLIWSKQINSMGWYGSISTTNDGGYISVGDSNPDDNTQKLIKYDQNGNEQWSKIYPETSEITLCGDNYDNPPRAHSIVQTNDNGFVIGDILGILKFDSNGNFEWNSCHDALLHPSADENWTFDVKQTNDGGYIATGWLNTQDFKNNIGVVLVLYKVNQFGEQEWYNYYGVSPEASDDEGSQGFSVSITNDNGFIISGTYDGYNKGYLIKTNQFGNITSTFEIPLNNPNRKLEKTVNLKGQEFKSQTNQPVIEIYDDGTIEKKVIIE